MEAALSGTPAIPFRVPPGLELVRVDSTETSKERKRGDTGSIFTRHCPNGSTNSEPGDIVTLPVRRRDSHVNFVSYTLLFCVSDRVPARLRS